MIPLAYHANQTEHPSNHPRLDDDEPSIPPPPDSGEKAVLELLRSFDHSAADRAVRL